MGCLPSVPPSVCHAFFPFVKSTFLKSATHSACDLFYKNQKSESLDYSYFRILIKLIWDWSRKFSPKFTSKKDDYSHQLDSDKTRWQAKFDDEKHISQFFLLGSDGRKIQTDWPISKWLIVTKTLYRVGYVNRITDEQKAPPKREISQPAARVPIPSSRGLTEMKGHPAILPIPWTR